MCNYNVTCRCDDWHQVFPTEWPPFAGMVANHGLYIDSPAVTPKTPAHCNTGPEYHPQYAHPTACVVVQQLKHVDAALPMKFNILGRYGGNVRRKL